MPKKIKVFTKVPLKTLGDASAAKKILNLFQDEDVEIEWVVIRDEPLEDKALTNIPKVRVTHVKDWDEIDVSSYEDADMFMFYPDVDIVKVGEPDLYSVSPEFKNFILKLPLNKIVITGTEYNSDKLAFHRRIRDYYSRVYNFETGFGALGIIMEAKKTPEDLLKQFKETEPKLSEHLFGSQQEKDYFANTHLYFGYYNTSLETRVSPLNTVDKHGFILNCIRDALHENKQSTGKGKDIDIVVPVTKEVLIAVLNDLTAEERAQLVNITWSSQDKIESVHSGEGSGLRLRVINPFPLKNPAMLYLTAQSSPLTMCTGDQSFTEALTYHKLCFYQIMFWKQRFYDKYLEELEKFCIEKGLGGKEAVLYQFYLLQKKSDDKTTHREPLLKFYHENKAALLQQQEIFAEYLQKKCNLHDTFLLAIKSALNIHPLLKACAIRDEKTIRAILTEEKMPKGEIDNIRDPLENTPFLVAVQNFPVFFPLNYLPTLRLLLQTGSNINCVNREGEHAFTFALNLGDLLLIEFLLKNNISLELQYKGKTILEYAKGQPSTDLAAQKILYHHANTYLTTLLMGQSAEDYIEANKTTSINLLGIATKAGRLDVIKAIINRVNFEDPSTKEKLQAAVEQGIYHGRFIPDFENRGQVYPRGEIRAALQAALEQVQGPKSDIPSAALLGASLSRGISQGPAKITLSAEPSPTATSSTATPSQADEQKRNQGPTPKAPAETTPSAESSAAATSTLTTSQANRPRRYRFLR